MSGKRWGDGGRSDSDTRGHSDIDDSSHMDPVPNLNASSDGDSRTIVGPDTDAYAHTHTYADTHRNPDSDSHSDRNPYSDAKSDCYPYSQTNSEADTHPYPHTCTHLDPYANADPGSRNLLQRQDHHADGRLQSGRRHDKAGSLHGR
ncbi:MAG: hypothetical protein OXO53_12030 [Chloroflexota bacterium]|nr:hypothetical protein [Chloroflexota bacterium]